MDDIDVEILTKIFLFWFWSTVVTIFSGETVDVVNNSVSICFCKLPMFSFVPLLSMKTTSPLFFDFIRICTLPRVTANTFKHVFLHTGRTLLVSSGNAKWIVTCLLISSGVWYVPWRRLFTPATTKIPVRYEFCFVLSLLCQKFVYSECSNNKQQFINRVLKKTYQTYN